MNKGPARSRPAGEPGLPLDRLLSPQEVARILGVPVRTLDHFAYERTRPRYFKIGRHRRYHPRDVQDWLVSRRPD